MVFFWTVSRYETGCDRLSEDPAVGPAHAAFAFALSLYAALNQIVALQPKGREIHIIADNLSAHKTQRVAQFLADHPKVHLHFTPTYSSWLNQVELWFGRIERDVVARGVFTSVKDLARKLMRYIRHHNQHAAPIKWAYRDFSHRIIATSDSAVTGH